jgi:hypothetical protein
LGDIGVGCHSAGGGADRMRVDRLLHHAHLVLTKGDSHRLAEALAGKGVMPLS